MTDIKTYIESGYDATISYSNFSKDFISDNEEVLSNIQKFIADHVSDILLINIQEDKLFLTKKELNTLHPTICNYLRFSECRGIKIYVFNTKDGGFKKAIGVFGGTTGRANERYFDKIINDEKYQNIVSKVSVKLTELLNTK